MGDALTDLVALLQGTGPAGALLASAIVGLTLAVIILAHLKDLWSGVRDRSQNVAFQARLMAALDKSHEVEEQLRRRVEDLGRDKGALQDELDEIRVQIALLRHQRRRLIEMLRRFVATLPEPPITAAARGPG